MTRTSLLADDPVARFLAEGGAIVAGAAALGAAGGVLYPVYPPTPVHCGPWHRDP